MSQVLVAYDERELLRNRSSSDEQNNDTAPAKERDDTSHSSIETNEAFMEMLGLQDTLTDLVEEEAAKPEATICNIALPKRCSRYLHPPDECIAFYIDNLLSQKECQDLIHMAAKAPSPVKGGFRYITQATHTAPDGSTFQVQLQNPNPHKLAVFHKPATVSKLWSLIKNKLPLYRLQKRFNCGPPLGLNPKLRVLRYDACDNDRFEAHFDATTLVDNTKSLLTVLIYLNDGDGVEFDGGETLYLNHHTSQNVTSTSSCTTKVMPRAGRVVIFEHDLYHSGAPLTCGTKYVLRTDVMFATGQKQQGVEDNVTRSSQKNGSPLEMEQSWDEDKKQVVTLCNLCQELLLSQGDLQVLGDMDLLQITVESFLSPGITMLKRMLLDSGMDNSVVDKLVHAAVAQCRDS